MDALRNVIRLVGPGGALVDTQPLPPGSRIEAGGEVLGHLDQSVAHGRFAATEPPVQAAVAQGVIALEREVVVEVPFVVERLEGLEERFAAWQDTRVDPGVLRRLLASPPPIVFRDRLRIRVFRAP